MCLIITMYFVYIVRCSDASLYTGVTNNLEKRVAAHNGQGKAGAKYTRVRRPVTLYYSESYETKSEALKREIAVKKLTHQQKLNLANQYDS